MFVNDISLKNLLELRVEYTKPDILPNCYRSPLSNHCWSAINVIRVLYGMSYFEQLHRWEQEGKDPSTFKVSSANTKRMRRFWRWCNTVHLRSMQKYRAGKSTYFGDWIQFNRQSLIVLKYLKLNTLTKLMV